MARARYCVSIAEGRDEFVYTFYCFAPAFFLARNPTHEEKLAFANQLVTRFKPRALNMKSFGCVKCGRQAHESVDWLRYALRDPGCLAVDNTLLPVCQNVLCVRKAQVALEAYRVQASQHQGVVTLDPEVLSCRTCFRDYSDTLPLQACSRCAATLYCSPECQKIGWKSHKQQCKGRVEAAKLTPEQLDQLDLLVSLNTGGTMELPDAHHPGKFPTGRNHHDWEGMLQCGQEAAMVRSAKEAEMAKVARKEKKGMKQPEPLLVNKQQRLALEGTRTDIFKYFGHGCV
ncbi:hypothetical protein ABBQ32_002539 [Trebouxia sp. C0010 RCD-2024]